MRSARWLLAIPLGLYSCDGSIISATGSWADPPLVVDADPVELPDAAPTQGMRRLSRAELASTLTALLDVPAGEVFTLLPEDEGKPYDNDYTLQSPSGALVDGADALAEALAARVLADPAKRAALIGCVPAKFDDADCLGTFIRRFGRLALRRPLAEAEVQELLGTLDFAVRAKSFDAAVDVVVRSLACDVEFLYRVELGAPVAASPEVLQLTAYELASRLSFTLWGRAPPAWLLDLAEGQALSTKVQVREAAARLLADPLAVAHLQRFHSMWLGYSFLPHAPELSEAMKRETSMLVEKVVFSDRADYATLFVADGTFVNSTLATHYGLPPPSGTAFAWVPYAGTQRQGILSHGSLLSNGAKQVDTSPTLRGKFIRERLFCQKVPDPPATVNTDIPPTTSAGSACKRDRYSMHASVGSCASCHRAMDPIGFGLEQFDLAGVFRSSEAGHPECAIDGKGNFDGVGDFQGPMGLGNLLVSSGRVEACATEQVLRFALGRERLPADAPWLARLTGGFTKEGRRFDTLMLDLVGSDVFAQRTLEKSP